MEVLLKETIRARECTVDPHENPTGIMHSMSEWFQKQYPQPLFLWVGSIKAFFSLRANSGWGKWPQGQFRLGQMALRKQRTPLARGPKEEKYEKLFIVWPDGGIVLQQPSIPRVVDPCGPGIVRQMANHPAVPHGKTRS